MNLLLSELLPLRTTRMLGDYAEDAVLPRLYGDLSDARFPLLRLSDSRFFYCDHPGEVGSVYVADQLSQGWEAQLESDDAGNTWTIVATAAPVPAGVIVNATGRGVRDPATGALIENPADVLADLTRIAGRNEDWTALRAECSALGLTVAGRVAESASIRAHIDTIAQSVGVIWTPTMARVYPTAATPVGVLDLHPHEAAKLEVKAALDDTADVLRLAYDRCDATGKALHYIELTASPRRYGGVVKEVVYPWLRSPANAETVGRAVLSRLAGERYNVAFQSNRIDLRPGRCVRLPSHPEWPLPGADPVLMVLGVEVDPSAAIVSVTAETLLSVPAVTVTMHSLSVPDTTAAGVDVAVRGGIATFTITDADGWALAGAQVWLDGGPPRTTDAQGNVRFPVTSGAHEITVEAAGYVPFSLQVTL